VLTVACGESVDPSASTDETASSSSESDSTTESGDSGDGDATGDGDGTTGDGDGTTGDGDGTTGDGDGTTGDGDGDGSGWVLPQCANITGAPGIGFGPDDVSSVQASTVAYPPGIHYAHGIVALDVANVLILHAGTELFRSEDAGCTWTSLGTTSLSPNRVEAGVGDRAWSWGDNLPSLTRVDGTVLTDLTPPVDVIGVGVDRADADHIRLAGDGGQWETFDAGANWSPIGSAPPVGSVEYRVAYDPQDLDHVLFGSTWEGFSVSFDGGQLWLKSSGLADVPGSNVNGFSVVVSPVDGNIVWAEALDFSANDTKFIYRSDDGGMNFTKVVSEDEDVDITLTNGVHLIPHATDARVLYWVFGTCFSGYGTNLYRYEEGAGLTWSNYPYADFGDLEFSPADPSFVYVGLDGDSNVQCPQP
jgi:hypothetical protein